MFRKKVPISSEISAGSMADITFLLLIFFLVTTSINNDKGLQFVLPPRSDTAENVKVKGVVNIFLNDDNQILVGTKDQEEEVAIGQLKDRLQVLNNQISAKGDSIIVSIKVMPGSSYKNYVDIIDQVTSAKIKRMSLAQ